jgi:serine phosphatase RsbU (regulator of sigma subunit)/PAS domain-containing protein
MSTESDLIQNLTMLNQIAQTLNQAVDVRGALKTALVQLVELMELETGWIFLVDPTAQGRWGGKGYSLLAHHNLPPALTLDNVEVWASDCECQSLCDKGRLSGAYNEVRCSRLASASGDRHGLTIHASTPLRSGDRILGILNVAAADWPSFSPQALALLTNVGSQMGIALERARLFDLLRERRIHEQAALLDLSNQLLSRLDLDDLMQYLVENARQLLEADGCALLLLDQEPDYLAFYAASGWYVDPVAEGHLVPADERSGPGWVIRTQQPLLAEDITLSDPVSWMPAWLRAEGFRGHAVVPLIAEGRSIGALVINTRHPRLLDENEVRFLHLMANQAAIAIEKARLHQEEIKRQRMEQELAVARQIQLSFLPEACPVVPGWDIAACYQAARLVGGDFYDFFELPGEPGHLGIVIADVADKGVPAALYMALSRTMIRTTALSGRSPAAALMRANELMLKDSQADLFVSAFYATLDVPNGRLTYANAGHNWPLWLHVASGESQELAARGIVLGIFENIELEEREIEVTPGDFLTFYTDGVTEAMNAEDELFGEERLRAAVATAAPEASAQQVLEAVIDAVNAFTGDTPQSDDFTLLVFKRNPL